MRSMAAQTQVTAEAARCVCAERGYCADVPDDPNACPVCRELGTSEPCPSPGQPAITCAPWCVYGDGHPDELFAEDQTCMSADARVDLSLYPGISEHLGPDGYGDGADQLSVYGALSPVEPVHVRITHDGQPGLGFFEVKLTPAEARQLAETLQLVLGQIGE